MTAFHQNQLDKQSDAPNEAGMCSRHKVTDRTSYERRSYTKEDLFVGTNEASKLFSTR